MNIKENYIGFSGTVISALRYCLGRRTYMPSLVIGFVTPYLPEMETKDLYVIQRDIVEHGKFVIRSDKEGLTYDDRGLCKQCYGDECDYKTWMDFLEKVEAELYNRKEDTEDES